MKRILFVGNKYLLAILYNEYVVICHNINKKEFCVFLIIKFFGYF